MYPHQNNGHPYLESYMTIAYFSGTETANQYPGYMEGAIIAAENTRYFTIIVLTKIQLCFLYRPT
jgi:monoamine oxidase